MIDQAAMDSGTFDLAWLLSLEGEPPFQLFTRAPPPATALGRAFSPLASQRWTTVAMAYLKELDTLQTRRAEVTRHRHAAPAAAASSPSEEAGQASGEVPRRRPKAKAKADA